MSAIIGKEYPTNAKILPAIIGKIYPNNAQQLNTFVDSAKKISDKKSNVVSPKINAMINIKDKPLSSFVVESKGEDVKATREKKLDLKTSIIIIAVVGTIGFIAIRKTEQKVREIERK